jgi:hypothetical protein
MMDRYQSLHYALEYYKLNSYEIYSYELKKNLSQPMAERGLNLPIQTTFSAVPRPDGLPCTYHW